MKLKLYLKIFQQTKVDDQMASNKSRRPDRQILRNL